MDGLRAHLISSVFPQANRTCPICRADASEVQRDSEWPQEGARDVVLINTSSTACSLLLKAHVCTSTQTHNNFTYLQDIPSSFVNTIVNEFQVVYIKMTSLFLAVRAHRSSRFQWMTQLLAGFVCLRACVGMCTHLNCASISGVSPVMQGGGTRLCFWFLRMQAWEKWFPTIQSMPEFLLCTRQVFLLLRVTLLYMFMHCLMHFVCACVCYRLNPFL